MQKITIIANDVPYGTERTYNAFRVAMHLSKRENISVNLFLMADAVTSALPDQKTPDGYYNLKKMIQIISKKATIRACGGCMDARGIQNLELIPNVKRSDMEELTDWIEQSDKVINF
jgi:uncharacterized protein involved in oxidation of intracellular sulfur